MVDPGTIRVYRTKPKVTFAIEDGRPCVKVSFTAELYQQIQDEAKRKHISFGAMVRHLCEASIDGIP